MKRHWSYTAGPDSLANDPEMAGLVLRLGAAVNALWVTQRWIRLYRKRRGVAAQRDLLWSFLVGAAHLKETIDGLLRPNYRKIVQLARQDGAREEAIKDLGQLISKKPQGLYQSVLVRARNKLVFHWDPDAFRHWAEHHSATSVVWAEGTSDRQQIVFSASLNAILDSVMPGASEAEVHERIGEVFDASGLVVGVFQRAIHAYVSAYL